MRSLWLVGFVLSCGSEERPAPPPTEPPKPAEPAVKQKIVPVDYGNCALSATGAFTVDETIPGARNAATSKYWSSDEPLPALTVNCNGKDLRLSIVAKPDASVPHGPKSYALDGKRGDLLLIGRAGDSLKDFKGTVDITGFDQERVTGTIAVTAKQNKGGSVKLSGTFDLRH